MHTAFITREITTYSPFYQFLTTKGFDVKGHSFIEFLPINISSIPNTDWIFFYSKNGIRFFFEQLEQLNLKIENLDYQWATIGQASATYLASFNIKADFIGTGEPNSTSKGFLKIAKSQKVLFPRATNSKKSIQNILGKKIESIDLIVYNNVLSKSIKKRSENFLAFTSPLNAKAYFQHFQPENFQHIIAIGTTTAKALTELGINDFTIAEQPSERGLAEAILKK